MEASRIEKIKLNAYIWIKSFYKWDRYFYIRNLNRKYDLSKRFIFVYTMGKVGSSSIYESLKTNGKNFNIIHLHMLNSNNLKRREQLIKKNIYRKIDYSRHLYTNLLWKPIWVKKLLKKINKPVEIITVVRDPMSRNISLFFQWVKFKEMENAYLFESGNDDYPFKISTPKDDLSVLNNLFLNSFTRLSHEEWLQEEFYNVFNIDLLNIPFDKNKGFSIFENKEIKLLILSLERIDETFEEAISIFLCQRIGLLKINDASSKKINLVYDKFKKDLRIPQEYLDTLYESDYIKHFYTSKEIESFKFKWK